MNGRTCRDTMIGLAVFCAAAIAGSAIAQTPNLTNTTRMTVTTDDVYVRSGSTDAYYPFGRLKGGTTVAVLKVDASWAEVMTWGDGFRGLFGYIEVSRNAADVQVMDDGKRLKTLTPRMSLLGANLNSPRPADSWKPIWKPIPIGTEFDVLEVLPGSGVTYYKVKLHNEHARGWINTAHLRAATPDEERAFETSLPKTITAAVPGRQPTVPATNPRQNPLNAPTSVLPADERPAPDVSFIDDELYGPPVPYDYQPEPAVDTGSVVTSQNPVVHEPIEQQEPVVMTPPDAADTVATPVDSTPTPAPRQIPSYKTDLADLEAAFEALKKEPIETAEVLPLRTLYLDLAERASDSRRIQRYANARAKQLQIWSDVQARRLELSGIKTRISSASEDVAAARLALDRGGDYVAVGRLLASTIFDGERLPRLYRLQDAGTGRTVAYVKPSKDFDLVTLLDQVIGIVGDKAYDPTLQLHVVEPIRHIDLLAPKNQQEPGERDTQEEQTETDAETATEAS